MAGDAGQTAAKPGVQPVVPGPLHQYTILTMLSTPTIFYRLIVDCVLRQDSAALVTLAMHLNHLTCLSARLLTMD